MFIHKYTLELREHQQVALPKTKKFLSAQMQSGRLCVWFEVDGRVPTPEELNTNEEVLLTDFIIVGTGHRAPPSEFEYLATVQDGRFVWHLYARGHK